MPDRIDPLLDQARVEPSPDDDLGELHDLDGGDPPLGAREDLGEPAVLPGADRPEWLLPSLVVAFAALISWLAIFGPDDGDDRLASGDEPVAASVSVAQASDPGPADSDSPDAAAADAATGSSGDDAGDTTNETAPVDDGSDVGVDGAVVDPIADAEAEAAVTTAPDAVTDLDLPPAGTIRVGADEFALARSCVGLRPFAPADDGDVVSAHVFTPDGTDVEQVIERWVTGDGIGGVRVDGPGAAGVRQVSITDGPDGAFTATLERPDGQVVDVALHPLPESERSCDDVVVTNEPGQLAFPHTRAVMAVCTSGSAADGGRVVAVLTEGARVIAEGNDDGTASLTLRAPETLSSPPLDLADPAGELFVDGSRLGYSGLVTDGDVSRDLTFDVDVAGARECTDADSGDLP